MSTLSTRSNGTSFEYLKYLSDDDLKLDLALAHASFDHREGPWYGPWDLAAHKLDRIERRQLSMTIPIMFPQHPVSFDVVDDGDNSFGDSWIYEEPIGDTKHWSGGSSIDAIVKGSGLTNARYEDKPLCDNTLSTDELDIKHDPVAHHKDHSVAQLYPIDRRILTTKLHQLLGLKSERSESPDPLDLISLDKPIYTSTPPIPNLSPMRPAHSPQPNAPSSLPPKRKLSESPRMNLRWLDTTFDPIVPHNISIPISLAGVDSYASSIKKRLSTEDKKLLKEAHRLWSTRVPDFLRRVFKLWKDGKISIFDLVIEIKKPKFQANIVALAVLRKQVMCQADHIFESEPLVQALGCILAVGSKWRYEEIHRPKVNHTVRAMDKDPDYVPHESEPSSASSRARYWKPLEPSPEIAYGTSTKPVVEPDAVLNNAFGEHAMIRLDDPVSDSLLEAVYQRLKLLNPQFWTDEDVNDGDKVNLTEIFDGRDGMDIVEDDASEASDAVRDVNGDLEDDELAGYDIDMDI